MLKLLILRIQMPKILIFLMALQISWAESSVNYYFKGLVEYGIEQEETMGSAIVSKILTEVKHTNWKNIVIDLDVNLSGREKRKIISEWENVYKRFASKSEMARRRRGYEGIPAHYAERYRKAFGILEGIIVLSRKGNEKDYFRLYTFFDNTFKKLEKLPGLRRQTRILLLQIHQVAIEIAES